MDLSKYQTKSITPVDDYKFTLSDELKKIAEDELRETEEVRNHAIKAMRDWIMDNPRIEKCRMDAKFLLRFLRFRKFSIPMAQEALERYLVFREGAYGYDWFSNMDFNKPNIKSLIDNGIEVILPERDHLGRKVLISRLAAADPKITSIGSEGLTLGTMVMETLLDDEENQIRGLVYVADVSGIQLSHYQIFPLDIWFKFGKNIEKTLAARHKSFHIVNVHPSLQFIANFALKHMPDKLRERVKFYSSFDELKDIEKDHLPQEYGGKVPMKEMIEPWKQKLEEKRDFFLNYNNMKVNRVLYPQPVLNCVVETLKIPLIAEDLFEKASNCRDEELSGIQGSFRKLEID